jgi:hypothetical protein
MVDNRSRPPLPPMILTARTQSLLIGLRLFLGVITVMAIYTFLHGLP